MNNQDDFEDDNDGGSFYEDQYTWDKIDRRMEQQTNQQNAGCATSVLAIFAIPSILLIYFIN